MNAHVVLSGLREAQQALAKAGGSVDDARALNRQVVQEVLVPGARAEVPVRSGSLKATIDADADGTYGYVLAGSRGDVEYAGVIHFGWSTRGLGGGLGGTAKERRTALQGALGRSRGNELTKRSTNRAARYGGARGGRGRVRGGPIAPQPFIYDAIDARQREVFAAYERQLEHRFEIEGLL